MLCIPIHRPLVHWLRFVLLLTNTWHGRCCILLFIICVAVCYWYFDWHFQGGAFDGYKESPFGIGKGEGVDRRGDHADEWIVARDRYKYDEIFDRLGPVDGKISGAVAKTELVKSRLPNSILGKVWKLSDLDKDGMLDADEFALAMHLIGIKLDGFDLPNDLPPHLVPPSKRFL